MCNCPCSAVNTPPFASGTHKNLAGQSVTIEPVDEHTAGVAFQDEHGRYYTELGACRTWHADLGRWAMNTDPKSDLAREPA